MRTSVREDEHPDLCVIPGVSRDLDSGILRNDKGLIFSVYHSQVTVGKLFLIIDL